MRPVAMPLRFAQDDRLTDIPWTHGHADASAPAIPGVTCAAPGVTCPEGTLAPSARQHSTRGYGALATGGHVTPGAKRAPQHERCCAASRRTPSDESPTAHTSR